MAKSHLNARPEVFFRNYDYADDPSGPGKGLFNGPMDRFKSIKEFLEHKRKRRKKQMEERKNAFVEILFGIKKES